MVTTYCVSYTGQKGRRKSADLRGQIADSYSVRCRTVESMSTGGNPSRVEK